LGFAKIVEKAEEENPHARSKKKEKKITQ